jgi:hypothetical protein
LEPHGSHVVRCGSVIYIFSTSIPTTTLERGT